MGSCSGKGEGLQSLTFSLTPTPTSVKLQPSGVAQIGGVDEKLRQVFFYPHGGMKGFVPAATSAAIAAN